MFFSEACGFLCLPLASYANSEPQTDPEWHNVLGKDGSIGSIEMRVVAITVIPIKQNPKAFLF